MTANAGKCVFFHVRKILNKGEKLTPEWVRKPLALLQTGDDLDFLF